MHKIEYRAPPPITPRYVSQAKAIDRGNWNALEEDLAMASSSPDISASHKPGRLSVKAAESQLRSGVAAIVLAGEQVRPTVALQRRQPSKTVGSRR